MPKNVQQFELPKMNPQIQGSQNVVEEIFPVDLSGQWVPSIDDTKIGKNFKTLTNMRYSDDHPKGVLGMEKLNDSAIPTYIKVRSAFQFLKETPDENHVLVQAYDAGETTSKVLQNKSLLSAVPMFKFNSFNSASGDTFSKRSVVIASPPNTFTLEIMTRFTSLGTIPNMDCAYLSYVTATGAGAWRLGVFFGSNGLKIEKVAGAMTEIGSDIVKCNANAAWQVFRFQVTKTDVTTATVDVYLDGTFQQTVDCDYETGGTAGTLAYTQYGNTTNNMASFVSYIKVATGLGAIL